MSSSKDASVLVDTVDFDTPEGVPAPRTRPAPAPVSKSQPTHDQQQRKERSRLSNVPLEDVVGSLPRSPSSGTSTSSSSSTEEQGERALPRKCGAQLASGKRVDLDDGAASSIPTELDLYGGTRPPHRNRTHKHKGVRKGSEQARRHRRSHSSRKVAVGNDTTAGERHHKAPESHGEDAGEEEDALLRKMRRKEKEFDSKIKEINDTFFSAGRQLVVRDDIIERLQAELASMRSQEHRRSQAEEQRYREKERELVEECNATVGRLQQENSELQRALKESAARQEQQQSVMDQLMHQLTEADAKSRELRRKHEDKLDSIRTKCQQQLQEFDYKFAALQRRCAELEADRADMQATQAQSQAKMLGLQMELSKEREGDSKALRDLWKEKEALREEVEATRLSMARLLQVMSEVPDLKDYLQWNELDSNFVFLGFPTRYFPVGEGRDPRVRFEKGGGGGRVDRGGYDGNDDGDEASAMLQAGRVGTGVDDGIYAGAASFHDSKNVWLNGRWVRQLQEIINAENMYTRLKKIKLYELEEAGQVSDHLPTARDVLQCRRQEKDYWVPYAVFQEAQHFKNKYYPKIPALSHFYPFLMRLNAIWHGKTQDRIRTMRKDLQGAQQQLVAMKRDNQSRSLLGPYESRHKSPSFASGWGRCLEQQGRERTTANVSAMSDPPQRRGYAFLVGLSRSVAEWEAQYDHLRREVRLNVANQRSLQLFKQYGSLFQGCLATVRELASQYQRLEEDAAFAAEVGATLYADQDAESEGPAHRPRRIGGKGQRPGRGSRYVRSDDEDSEDSGSESESVEPLPPPPTSEHRHGPTHHRKHHRQRHEHGAATQHDSSLAAWDARNSNAAEANNDTVESLLCVVQHSSEKVCGVADCLAERAEACCNDLEALLVMLRDVYLPQIVARKLSAAAAKEPGQPQSTSATTTTRTTSTSSSSSTASESKKPDASGTAVGSAESSVMAIQKQIRDILRDQYGPGYDKVNTATRTAAAESTADAGDTAFLRAMRAMENGGHGAHSASPERVLSSVVASVFDFSHEVRSEVRQAQKALQVIATEAMAEAEAL